MGNKAEHKIGDTVWYLETWGGNTTKQRTTIKGILYRRDEVLYELNADYFHLLPGRVLFDSEEALERGTLDSRISLLQRKIEEQYNLRQHYLQTADDLAIGITRLEEQLKSLKTGDVPVRVKE